MGPEPVGKKFHKWNTDVEGVVFDDAYADIATFVMPGSNVKLTPEYYEETVKVGNKTYGVVTIKDRKWMAENLDYDTLSGKGSWCYDNNNENCVKYGRLYYWTTAMKIDESTTFDKWKGFDFPHQGICPDGWHLPNKAEFDTLVAYAGGSSIAGGTLKTKSGWVDYSGAPKGNGTDNFGFSGKPGSHMIDNNSNFGIGQTGYWWASTVGNVGPYDLEMVGENATASVKSVDEQVRYKNRNSVRCAAYLKEEFEVTVVGGTGGGAYKPGETVTVTAGAAPAGTAFGRWTTRNDGVVFDDALGETATFTMPGGSDITITANFGRKYNVVVNAGENAAGGGEHTPGKPVAITAGKAPEGKKFKIWTAESDGVIFDFDYDDTTAFIMPENDVTVTAEFGESMEDARDGKTYRWVKIGNQKWMAENLNYEPAGGTSRCYGDSAANCAKYGRLYDWAEAMGLDPSYNSMRWEDDGNTVEGICPSGWHLPKMEEWEELVEYVGGYSAMRKNLAAKRGWEKSDKGNGVDAYEFSALPGGYADYNGSFKEGGLEGQWWIPYQRIGPAGTGTASSFRLDLFNSPSNYGYIKSTKSSVRCVMREKIQVAKPEFTPSVLVYNGKVQWAGIAENDRYIVKDGAARDAGDYTARVVLKDALAYEWADGTNYREFSLKWSIAPAPGRFVPLTIDTAYTPALKLTDFALPPGYAWAAATDSTGHLNAGDGQTFAATYTATDGRHTAATGNITVNVAKATGLAEIDAAVVLFISSDDTGVKTFNLSGIAIEPADHGGLRYILGADSYDYEEKILEKAPTIAEDTLLAYQGIGRTSGAATQVVTVESRNYENIDVTITFRATPDRTYDVTVNGGAGSGSYIAGAPVNITAAPAEPGKVFDKWTTADGVAFADGKAASTRFTMPAKDVTVEAAYKDTAYKITFFADGGSVSPAFGMTGSGGKLASLPTPTRTGYTFAGWYTVTGDDRVETSTPFRADAAIYSRWTANVYKVTWNADGGVPAPTLAAVTYTDSITAPAAMEKEDHFFGGWYVDSALTAAAVFPVKHVTDSVAFYAKWTPYNCVVLWYTNGGDLPLPVVPMSVVRGGIITAPASAGSKAGFAFDGWYLDTALTAKATFPATVAADMNFYAKWTPAYTVTFNANGGTVSPASGTTGAGGTLSAALPTPIRGDYSFDGWYTTRTAGAKVTQSTAFTANDTIYARWTLITYTVTFNPNGGAVNPTSALAGADGKVSLLPTPVLDGYAFDGWYTAPAGGAKITESYRFDGDALVFARWIPLYTIRFNANGGTVSVSFDVTGRDGKLASLPTPVPAVNGETFNGWYTAPVGGAMVTTSYVFTGDATLYARWTPVAVSIVVTFNANGGSVNPASRVTTANGTLASLPTPTRSGYVFDDWYTSATVGSTVITTSTVFEANTTVYARWTPVYTVTFNPNGGTVSTTSAVAGADGTLSSLPVPARAGYAFSGWYTAESGGAAVTASTVFITNTTVYARWASHIAVTFSAGANGTLSVTVDGVPIASGDSVRVGKDVVFTAVPANGYGAVKWTVNGNRAEVADTVLTYVLAGLSSASTVAVSFGEPISVASPDREIPVGAAVEEAAVAPVKALSGAVTVGPNPVKAGGEAAFYWTGGKAVSGSLSVFDAMGQKVAAVEVGGTRKIGAWKVGAAAEGTYLVRGVLTDRNGVRVMVSLLVGVAK